MLGRLSSYKQLVLPVLVLKYRGNILIPLLSPREENSIFDSLFWLSPKSSCQNSNNTSGIFSFHDFPSFNVMAVGGLMFEVISREAHDIRGINGNITPLGSARDIWMVHQNGQISIPPRSHQEPTSNSGSSSRKTAHESSDWETAICSEYRKISMILKDQNKCDDMLAESGIGILTSKTEYEFAGILENDFNFRLSRGVLERVLRRMRDVKSSVSANLLSNEDGVIHNVMRQRRKLLQLTADWYNDTENLECLIGKSVDVNALSVSDLGTALQICCRRPTATLPPGVKRIKTVRILVEAGATINPRDPDDTRPQFTPLDGAVLTGDLAVARHLLEKGACIDLETLKYAISYGRLDMVSLLVQFDMKFHAPALELAELYKESIIEFNALNVAFLHPIQEGHIPAETGNIPGYQLRCSHIPFQCRSSMRSIEYPW
ncbi:hypothetical protein TWF173_010487 [Orbilia oligospora]|nr:hypothetical protein TWF173_010487 [Orbilia oligospora]